MRKNIYCVFDTETIGLDKKWIYDLGCVITDKHGKIYHKARWIIKEVMDIPNIEQMAFYGKKIDTFYKGMESVSFKTARTEFNNILQEFNVNMICAYNLPFDIQALKATLELTNCGKKFLDKPITYFDIMGASCESFFQQKTFKKVAEREGWLTEKGNYRTTAEVAYRYVTGDFQFVESHTALEDCEIETIILQDVLRQKKKIVKNQIVYNVWRKAQVA